MRFFIALDMPEENRIELQNIQNGLRQVIPEARTTDNNNLHLTIAFVGEQNPDLKDNLISVLGKAAEAMGPFEVTPAYIDGFPKLHNPHTFWVGVKGDVDKLLILREKVKDGLVRLNLEVDERRFIPHIAIAKVSDYTLSQEKELELEKLMAVNFKPIIVNSIKLFESVPDEGFHRHNTLAEVKLEG
jgi:RNA 2',3'-cyclic 3'-phosphodiesterase